MSNDVEYGQFGGGAPSRPAGGSGRVPPHNLQAEESVLGALLLSRDAIGVVGEAGLNVRDFYSPAHQHIFDAVRSLYSSSGPVDVVTVADELRRHNLLDELGGMERLNELQNATPSVSGAEHYAKIVMDTALLRRLIHTAGEITDLAFSEPDDVTKAVDLAESKMFEVAEDKVVDSTREIGDLLNVTWTSSKLTSSAATPSPVSQPVTTTLMNCCLACNRALSILWERVRRWERQRLDWA